MVAKIVVSVETSKYLADFFTQAQRSCPRVHTRIKTKWTVLVYGQTGADYADLLAANTGDDQLKASSFLPSYSSNEKF